MSDFPSTYEESREAFLAAAEAAGFRHLRFRVPHEDSAELFLDFALLKRDPARMLIHVAGVHGVEGYAGSAVQTALLRGNFSEDGPSLLFVHGVNAYGMKFYRRANGQNVDLNRNYRKGPAAPNPDYALFADYLAPAGPGDFRRTKLRALWRAFRLGRRRAAQAIAAGQVSHPRGLFYMGDRVQRELVLLQELLKSHVKGAGQVLVLDYHTGLGKAGGEQLFVDEDADPGMAARVEKIFHRAADRPGANAGTYVNQGRFSDAIREVLPRMHYVLQEIGTVSALKVLDALRLENFEWQRRPAGAPRPVEVERAMLDAFCPASPAWRKRALEIGVQCWREAEAWLRETDATEPA